MMRLSQRAVCLLGALALVFVLGASQAEAGRYHRHVRHYHPHVHATYRVYAAPCAVAPVYVRRPVVVAPVAPVPYYSYYRGPAPYFMYYGW